MATLFSESLIVNSKKLNTQQKNEFAQRISEVRRKKNLTKDGVSEVLGLFRGAWGAFESGKRLPTTDQLGQISEKLNVSADWLLTGKGEMWRGAAETGTPGGVATAGQSEAGAASMPLGVFTTAITQAEAALLILLREIPAEDVPTVKTYMERLKANYQAQLLEAQQAATGGKAGIHPTPSKTAQTTSPTPNGPGGR